MNKKIIISLFILSMLLFSMVGVLAQDNKYMASENSSKEELMQLRNRFENKYQFNCSGECVYKEENNQLKLEVTNKLKVMNLFHLELRETYELNEEGEILRVRQNIWSRLFNREVLKN